MAVERDKLSIAERKCPQHVAIIMDGNGRWAEERSKPRHAGHRAGVTSVRAAVEKASESGVSVLTLFAFSSENWRRPREEVTQLMGLFFDVLQREIDELHRNEVRIRFVGQLDLLSDRLVRRMHAAERRTAENAGLELIVAVAYGGRWDITQATQQLAKRVAAGELEPGDIDEQNVADSLALSGVPDPDLLIRTGGEHRISNFLLWNLAYSELYFCDCLWPDFDKDAFERALEYFARRQRRFGRTSKQLGAA